MAEQRHEQSGIKRWHWAAGGGAVALLAVFIADALNGSVDNIEQLTDSSVVQRVNRQLASAAAENKALAAQNAALEKQNAALEKKMVDFNKQYEEKVARLEKRFDELKNNATDRYENPRGTRSGYADERRPHPARRAFDPRTDYHRYGVGQGRYPVEYGRPSFGPQPHEYGPRGIGNRLPNGTWAGTPDHPPRPGFRYVQVGERIFPNTGERVPLIREVPAYGQGHGPQQYGYRGPQQYGFRQPGPYRYPWWDDRVYGARGYGAQQYGYRVPQQHPYYGSGRRMIPGQPYPGPRGGGAFRIGGAFPIGDNGRVTVGVNLPLGRRW